MKERMTNICPFADAWQDKDETRYPKSEVGYIRADYEDRWWNTVWPIHRQLETPELVREFDAVYAAFCREFPDFHAVCDFCRTSAEPTSSDTEYNAYLEGEHGVYWFRFITRYRDYNLYLHCLSRAVLEG